MDIKDFITRFVIMKFEKYLHVEKYGNTEVDGINVGTVCVFPKLDGTSASAWYDEAESVIKAGSRNRELTLDKDNAGFYEWLLNSLEAKYVRHFLNQHPHLRLFGEWLVPHTIKDYRDDAWRRFYVFDIYDVQVGSYLPFGLIEEWLSAFDVDYVPCQKIVKNGDYDSFIHEANNAFFMMKDGCVGEGVVLKNYDYINGFGRYAVAKVVRNEFKEKHYKTMGAPSKEITMQEEKLVEYFTKEMAEKVLAKIKLDNDGCFGSKDIPRLLDTCYYDFFREELWDAVKKTKCKRVEFGILKRVITQKVKDYLPQLF